MDIYALMKFAHIIGFILLGAGLLAVFISELRAYRTKDIAVFAEAARYTAVFYDALALPGAVLLAGSGLLLIFELDLAFFDEPWLVAMWGLFLFELIEGNTVTRIQFRRTLKKSVQARDQGALTDAVREEARTVLGQVAHFLDVPLFSVIVYCGAVRPDSWGHVVTAVALALVVAFVLTVAVPRLARPGSG